MTISHVFATACRIERNGSSFRHNSYMKGTPVASLFVQLALTSIAFAASAIHIGNKDTSIALEAGSAQPAISGFTRSGCSGWSFTPVDTLIRRVEVDSRGVDISWTFQQALSQITPTKVRLVYDSSEPHLRAFWEWNARAPFGPIEHSIEIQNLSPHDVWLPMQDSLQLNLQLSTSDQLEHVWIEKGAGGPSAEGVHRNAVRDGYQWTGESSTYAHPAQGQQREMIPYTLLQRADHNACGWYVGIEFSGRTRIAVQRNGSTLATTAGLNPEPGPFRTLLQSGESFFSPTVFVGVFRGGADGAGNELRPWVRDVLNHRDTIESPHYPEAVNNSWGSGMQINEAQARSMIRDSAELGFEMFHLDAGWFRGVGDWYPDPKKFPHGLALIADYAHSLGLKFGLWMDWAQASLDDHAGSLFIHDPVTRNWLIADPPSRWKQGDEFKGITIDLGVPAAHAWALETVKRVVNDYHVDMLEHDGYVVAQGCSRPDHPHAPADPAHTRVYEDSGFLWADSSNSTDVSYHATLAYYDVQSQLRKLHPNLLLEICNDGGRMVDFGSAAHGDYFSISDAYDPLSNRRAFSDASYVLPQAMLETYVQKWPAASLDNFRYVLRSGMMGWFTLMLDTTAWNEEEHAAAREAVAVYKEKLRPLIREANLYHVSSRPDGVHWDGIEYFDPRRSVGVLFAFRGSSIEDSQHTFVLQGLDPQAIYHLEFQDHPGQNKDLSGRELMSKGLQIILPGVNTSDLVFLSAITK